jgi:hypothetical protein
MQFSFGGMQALLLTGILATFQASSSSYGLKSYDLGGGGGGASSSATYGLNATTGSQSGQPVSSSTYGVRPGLAPNINATVPGPPTVTNPSSYYDRLRIVLTDPTATGPIQYQSPSDTKYAIAISPDNFTTATNYVKSDNSIGGTLALTDYQTYTAWGGASGFMVLGLQPNKTYTVKVKAFQGKYSGSAYGPTGSAATVNPSMTFSVATVGNSTPPFTVNFSGLAVGSVFNASDDAKLSLSTNALSGGTIYLNDSNAGLSSTKTSYTLNSTAYDLSTKYDLSSYTRGYGAVITSVTQLDTKYSPYDGTGNTVGAISTSMRRVASNSTPIAAGSLIVRLMARTDMTVPAAADYRDTLTFVAAMSF